MFKELIDSALASLMEPYAEEIRKLKADNDALRARVSELEKRPDIFDVRSYIEERIREETRDLPDVQDFVNAMSDRRIKKLFEDIDFQSPLNDGVREWASEQDWTEEVKAAVKEAAEEGSLDEAFDRIMTDHGDVLKAAVVEWLSKKDVEVRIG